jgi:Na+-transporting NADH:ubiquinone oxidoreductase subunit A
MGLTKIKKGLDVPITGQPEQVISDGNVPRKVALLGEDYVGMKPTMAVKVGDQVKIGQTLFTDKKMSQVRYTAPGAGTVIEINRGEKRKFLSIIIEVNGEDDISFSSYKETELDNLNRDTIKKELLESGLWTALRVRPFSKVADPDTTPHSIFITAMDSNPLAPSVEKIIEVNRQNFLTGLKILTKLTDGKLFLCKYPGSNIPTADIPQLTVEEFSGPHPTGLAGTHIHFLDPVGRKKSVWYINPQDVIGIGYLFSTGKLFLERIISLAGPAAKNPRLIRTRLGAAVDRYSQDTQQKAPSPTWVGTISKYRYCRKIRNENFLAGYFRVSNFILSPASCFPACFPRKNLLSQPHCMADTVPLYLLEIMRKWCLWM